MRLLQSASFAVLVAALSGCLAPQSAPPSKTTAEAEPSHVAIDDGQPQADLATANEAHAFAAASNAFGGDLYLRLANEPGNFAMSPASISIALAMTAAGARGDTQTEMNEVLHLDGDPKATSASAAKMLATLDAPRMAYTLDVKNRLFGDKAYPFDAGFLSLTKNDFGAELIPLDFAHAPEPARTDINGWVSSATHGKIGEILPSGSVDGTTSLVLVNAIYLNANWQTPFQSYETRNDAFHSTPGESAYIPTMRTDLDVGYADTDGVRVIDLPYVGGDLAMTVLLPDDASGLGALEQKVAHDGVDGFVAKEKKQLVDVALPRFTVETNGVLRLNDALTDLGMKKAFEDGAADFSGMIDSSRRNDASKRLHLANAFHKAFVAVTETGTEAAAASAVVMTVRGVAPTPDARFTADHPFLFAIRDLHSGAILFIGRVVKPV